MNTWAFIEEKVNLRQIITLMLVIDNKGSSPGKQGFKMVVSEDGQLFGSIGGGTMEREMVEAARRIIKEGDFNIIIKTENQYTDDRLDESKRIVKGSQTIAFYPINPKAPNTFAATLSNIRKNESGQIRYSESGISYQEKSTQERKFQLHFNTSEDWEFLEQIGIVNKLYIFGAGHVSLALSKVCSILDFEIHVFDDRDGLNTFENNTWAVSKQIIDYSDIKNITLDENNAFVVIMSHTHQSDELILSQLLQRKLKYLAMMGSKKKVQKIISNLLAKGFSEGQFDELHSPIGIPINSVTPEEIAISIAAEMISVKNA